jgi:hypothetical protein
MTIARAEVDSVVSELFRQRRRQWTGMGGGGNPHETWADLQSMVSMGFLLDADAVFTVALWASAQLNASLGQLQTIVTTMDTAAAQLSADTPPALAASPQLNQASWALNQALITLDGAAASSASGKITEARTKLEEFATASLAPVVSPGLTGQDQRTPSEARAELQTQLPLLSAQLSMVEDAVDVLDVLVEDLDVVLPPASVTRFVRQVKTDVDAIRTRFLAQAETERLTQARTDLIRLAADCATLERLTSVVEPTLVRTSVACTAYGSGDGAPVVGTISAPYELLDGVTDQLRLGFDGGVVTQYSLPDQPNVLYLDFPISLPVGGWYTVPGPGPWTFRLSVDGRQGAAVSIAAGMWTVAAVLGAVGAVFGAIPENPPLSPFLLVNSSLVIGPPPPIVTLYSTVRMLYNVGVPLPPNPGIGAYIEITGDAALMNAFGFMGQDLDNPLVKTERVYWRPVERREVTAFLQRQTYAGSQFGERVRMYPTSRIVTSGKRGYITPAAPTTFGCFNYSGTGVWYPDITRLTLSGDDLALVQVGDRVVFSGVVAVYQVTRIREDGVELAWVSGAVAAAGSYATTVSPPVGSVTAGMTLTFEDRGQQVYARISGVSYDANGRLLLALDRRPSTLPYGATYSLSYTVISDVLTIQSANNGTTGRTEVSAFIGADASPALGLASGTDVSTVDQLYGATADFTTAGVQIGDYVYLGGALLAEVQELVSSKVVRVDRQLLGTVSGTMEFRHRLYQLYEDLRLTFPVLDTAPTIDDIQLQVNECLRAPQTLRAAAVLRTELAALTVVITTLQAAITSFRAEFGTPSAVMRDCRDALEESGADRALNLLSTGRLADLFSASTDDSSYSRRLMRSMRKVSRTTLGTSVFAQSIRQEADALAAADSPDLGIDILAQVETGGPGSTKR